MKSCLVVPSIREDSLRSFLAEWDKGIGPDWDEMIVVEDNPSRTFSLPPKIKNVAWDDIEDMQGKNAWIFSRRDSAIRCAGFVMAYRMGADIIVTLDDDCYPEVIGNLIVAGHLKAMGLHTRWTESIPGMRTRGLPYYNRGQLPFVMANMGLWTGIPDLDAIQTLNGPKDWMGPPPGNRIIPSGQYFPMCGMNLAFKREATPLFYFPLMGENQPYRRFDDIFCGIIAKKVMDHLGWHFSVGEPFIRHERASHPMVNLEREAPGIVANERFWEVIDEVRLIGRTPCECMEEIGQHLGSRGDSYLKKLGEAIGLWTELFE